MDTVSFIGYIARISEHSISRVLVGLGGLALLALAVLALTFIVGSSAAALLAPEPAEVFAAPFRW